MVFSSLIFTFIFLPPVILLYFVARDKYKNYILLAASLIFYAYGEPGFVFVMLLSIAVNYGLAVLIGRFNDKDRKDVSKGLMILDVILNLGLLFVFKYLNYTVVLLNHIPGIRLKVPEIVLPIGISFFTFQALSYCIDVYRGRVKVQKNPLYVALYISFFPQLIAGPIVRYQTIEERIADRSTDIYDFSEGVRRFFLGFAKKVILANNLSVVAGKAWEMEAAEASPLMLWLGSICFSLQIFYDFSGYSDMAIGLGRIFGFKLEENFNYPYISASVTEFWRRWHISLSSWFRDYVYIPLGGSRVSVLRNIFNLLIVWALTGIWHGANVTFLIWGLCYFLLLCIEKFIIRPDRHKNPVTGILMRVMTLFFVNALWVIFNSPDIGTGAAYLKGMFGLYGNPAVIDSELKHILREYGFFVLAGAVFSAPVAKYIGSLLERNRYTRLTRSVIAPLGYCFIFLWAVSFLILGSHNPFIYFNF